MPFTPTYDAGAVQPLLDQLRVARSRLEAAEIPPILARWLATLTEARGAHMSTRIEGNPLTEPEVRELFQRPPAQPGRAELENLDYRDAARLASQVADDFHADVDGGLIRSLHFVAIRNTDGYGTAGQYRTKQNAVRAGGVNIYLPPDPTDVPRLMDDLVVWVREARGVLDPLLLAAIAHAEFINIHPFDDGNGRCGRALTSYLAMRGGWRFRGLLRTEQVFGADVNDYYAQLRAFGDRYPGQRIDFTSWCEWFSRGLLRELLTVELTVDAWGDVRADLASDLGLSPRVTEGLHYVWLNRVVTSSGYARAMNVSPATAVADLAQMVAAGVVRRSGRGRATRYASEFAPFDEAVLSQIREGAGEMLAEVFPGPPTP